MRACLDEIYETLRALAAVTRDSDAGAEVDSAVIKWLTEKGQVGFGDAYDFLAGLAPDRVKVPPFRRKKRRSVLVKEP